MKNTLLATFLCLLAYIAQAQDTIHYFNKTFNPAPDTTNLLINAILTVEDGYIAAGGYTSLNDRAVFVARFNWQGDTIWFKIIDNSYTVGNIVSGTQLIRTHDGNCVLTYSKLLNMSKDIKLVKFDSNGAILWNNTYGDYANEEIYQVIETYDGGFALFGATYYPNDTTRYFLMKIKSDMEEDWTRTYMLDDSSKGLSFQQTADGGYILGGYAYSNDTQYDTYIIKTNSLGIVEWTNNFGGQYNDCGGIVNLLANGQYLITSCGYPNGNFGDWYMRLTKLNSAGSIVWDTVYYNKAYKSPQTPAVFLSDSTFVFLTYTFSNITGRVVNVMLHCDLSGNILWEQEFSSNLNEDSYLKDLRRTPDGGFIMAGYEYTSTPQKGYLVKTDSLGRSCSWVGCDSVGYVYAVGIPPVLPLEGGVRGGLLVYPNPAQDYLTISNLSTQQNTTFVLYDVLGKAVVRQALNTLSFGGGKGEATISTKHLPSGIYLYQIINPQNQTLQYGKVSIVR